MSSQRLVLRCKPCQEGEKHMVLDVESVEATSGMQFGENVPHEQFFTDAVSDWVAETLEGHSLIILLYGLPSSGKSYTAFGSPGESRSNPKARGIIVRCMDEFIKTAASKNNIAQIKGSFYHITSRGQVADLLDARKRNLQTKRIDNKFIFPDATKQSLTTTQDVVNLLEKAQLMRNATGVLRSDEAAKSINPLRDYKPHSTHAVFHYTIESCNNNSTANEVFASQLIIIDLAGSQIKKFYTEDSCMDNGLTALHNTLLSLNSSEHEAATESCLSTPLTQLLFPGFFGNSQLILINTLLMNDTEEHTTRKMINFCKGLYNSKAVSSPVCLMLSQTDLGSKMIKTDSLKRAILQELNVSNEQDLNLEIISQTAVSVNGMVFEQLSVKSLQAIVAIRDIERERLSTKQSPAQPPSISSYSARMNTLPPLTAEAQKTSHTSSLLPNNRPLSLQKAPLVPLLKPSSLPKVKPQIQESSSSSSSDSEDDKTIPVVSSNDAACPPPLNDIPHVLPRVLPLKQPQTNSLLPPANTVLKPIKPLRSRLHSPTSKTSIKVEPSLSSSSSSTSITKDQPKKRHRRRKSKLTKSSRSPSPMKHQTTTSSSDDEDTFDPSFKPGRLSFHPQTLRQENIQREPVRPVISFSGIKNITSNVPTEESMSNVLPSYEESSQNKPEQVNNELMSQHELHQSALFKGNRSHLKKLVMKYGIDYKDEGGHTALMYSVLGNQTKICESLISMGADVNATDNANLTALFWAVYHARPEIIKILLRNGADVHITDPHGRSVFHWVMKTPNALCLKALCKHVVGNIENQTDMEGLTPLHWAVMCEQHQHISTLLSCVPTTNVCAQDCKGRTPLNYAVLLFSPICIKAILDSRPTAATFVDFKGRTALHYACAEGSVDCVRALLACKSSDLHCQDNSGTTPLHWAAAANQPGIIQLLLRRGADRGQRDASDMTPLDHANQRNHTECIKLLESYGLLRQSSSWSIASQFSIHPPTPPELDEHGHVPMKRPSSSTDQQSPQDVTEMNPDQCRHDGLRLPADGHSNSTQSLLPTEETQQQSASGEETTLADVSRTVTASCFNWKQKLRKIFSIFSRHNVRVAPA